MPEISLREAVQLLEERIRANPQTFMKAVGGRRMFTAILALLQYIKSLPESELNKKINVELPS